MSGVGTMMVLASAPHTKQTAPELQLLNLSSLSEKLEVMPNVLLNLIPNWL